MTLYLQRLLNRSAGPVLATGPPAPALRPALQSGSPIFAFDQRLGNAELASDFGLVGASPPDAPLAEPAINSWAELPVPGTAQDRPAPLASVPTPATAPALSPEPSAAGEAAPAEGDRVPTPLRRRVKEGASPPAPSAAISPPAYEPPARRASSPPRRPVAERPIDLSVHESAPVAETPMARPEEVGAVPRSPPGPSTEPVQAAPSAPAAEVPRADPPPASSDRERHQPLATAEPAPRPRAAEPAAAAMPAAMAQPVVAQAPPLEPAGPSVGIRDIERIVEEKLRRRLANTPAAAAQPAQAPGREADPNAAPARKRPATAAEASLIGKLVSSAYQPMLFGVRRR